MESVVCSAASPQKFTPTFVHRSVILYVKAGPHEAWQLSNKACC